MAAFQYQALTAKGAIKKGVIDADNSRHARQLLREQNLQPVKIDPVIKNTDIQRGKKISAADLALFTRQLATLLSAGIPLEQALSGVCDQTEKAQLQSIITGVRTKVIEGFAFAEALGEYKNAFPELYRATVHAGEQTGQLDTVLLKLADYTEHQQKIRNKIRQALIYPSMMITVSALIITFLLIFVVPKIINVFADSGQSLPIFTQILIAVSTIMQKYWIFALGLVTISALLIKKFINTPRGILLYDSLLLKLPMFSWLMKSVNVARYVHTFSILFAAGVSVLETMRVSASLITNKIMRQQFEQALIQVREGTSIHQALGATKFLTPMALHLIASGEKSGQITDMMERTALHLDEEVQSITDTGLTLLEPLIILFMGAVVLFIVLATLLPIFSMEQLAL